MNLMGRGYVIFLRSTRIFPRLLQLFLIYFDFCLAITNLIQQLEMYVVLEVGQ